MSFSKCDLCENSFIISTDIIKCGYAKCKSKKGSCDECFEKLKPKYYKNALDESKRIFQSANDYVSIICLKCGKFTCYDHHFKGICFDCYCQYIPPCTCPRCLN